MFPGQDEVWMRVFAFVPPSEPESKPQAEVMVQRQLAQADAAARERAHLRWLEAHIADAPAPYDY